VITAPLAPPATGRRPLVVVTRVLAAVFGLLKLTATTYFLFFASAEAGGDPQGAFDWSVGVWSLALGAGYLVIAARLGRDARVLPLAVGLAVADVAFSVVKFFVYDERAPIPFTVATLLLLGLVVAASRPRRTA
jgi:hypothetical protein